MKRFTSALLRPALCLFAFLIGTTAAQAQVRRHAHHAGRRSSEMSFWNGTAINTPSPAEMDGEDYVRNHGTGVKLGAAWAGFRKGFEVGAFHQERLGQVGSLQGELLYYRQPTATGTVGGVRVPVLLVLNPFDNGSIHIGPQMQWQPKRVPVAGETTIATSQVMTSMVLGGELRLYCARFGMRFALPFSAFSEPQDGAHRLADQWKTGQMQVYVGIGID